MSKRTPDFSGWATRNNIKCADGRTIMQNAFDVNDGQTVPLVWNHQHDGVKNVLGYALLENRPEGVYTYGFFNESPEGMDAKERVKHGDINALSIYANKLKQNGGNVLHGVIREVSLVLAGANPGAYIDTVLAHGVESDEEAVIYTDECLVLEHSGTEPEPEISPEEDSKLEEKLEHAADDKQADENGEGAKEEKPMAEEKKTEGEETVQEVFDTLTDKQKTVVYALIGQALEDKGENETDNGGSDNMKHNAFDDEEVLKGTLTHADMEDIVKDAKRLGSMKEATLAHGIENVDYLFPDAQNYTNTPQFISRDMGWVTKVMNGVHHTPFSRIKSLFADITEDDARAKGYIKGNLKKEEFFSLLKRTTTPTTIYKKQKLDRDDVVDITDFDVVAWLKTEMRMMLDEELARAFLVGDGRLASSDDKINESNIRPIWTDADLYAVKELVTVASADTDDAKAKAFIRKCIKSRKDYKGSGNPVLFTDEDTLTDCLLIEDTTGRIIYESVDKLKTALRVSDIITAPCMENQTRTVDGDSHTLKGIIVNLNDYNVGADKGGAVNMFDDFDIDYNAMKYLIETRCSGALVKPYSALIIEQKVG